MPLYWRPLDGRQEEPEECAPPSKKHSAGVAIGSKTAKDVKGPDIWAKASQTSGWAYKCNTYWGVY
ncbi:lactococcin 972 family bacteriocin [Streptomyces chrestomyceticus]|uniref:lactococcin 972 family bacteriocin n=1 Tax=Streptomyces chrestomyceticus TaxID=68185 RepID=UPI0033EE6530